ncbi:hypothetical protein ES703_119142 [subsurface metagenome]
MGLENTSFAFTGSVALIVEKSNLITPNSHPRTEITMRAIKGELDNIIWRD